ncbi:unnamed protein product [Lymnaea stagnalis]|uniref:G-protein coupled receptors family 1 profile domain-containing protein n=1 Tax=Lymnaea stagnalis TaxID=6523 RepID=A0AAV2HHR1_LYMST
MGLKDGVTVSLFALAISDFSYLLISAMRRSATIVNLFPEVAPKAFSLSDVVYASFWYSKVFYDISTLIRVYTAVARACCVAIPLTFKNIFTKNVTIYVVCAVSSASLAIRVPMLACQGFQSVFDSKTNVTRLVLYFNSLRPAALAVTDIVNRNIIAWGTIIIVLISLFVLKYNLVSAAKFRHGRKSGRVTSSNENPSNFLVGKDLQVVRVVILVSIIFIICNVRQPSQL